MGQFGAEVMNGEEPDGTLLRDLGAHRLRDVSEPERVFALVHTSRGLEWRPARRIRAEAGDRDGE